MKTTLLTALLALSPGFVNSVSAQDKPDRPREEQKEGPDRESHGVEAKVHAALQEAAKLDEAGKKDAAENLRREARQMAEAAKVPERAAPARHGEGDVRKPDGPPRAELENKLKHVEQAMAHLREAGLPEPAEHLNQIANRFRAALHGPDQPRREEARREEPRREEGRREEHRREEGRREGPKGEEQKREERRPDNDIEALRREIQELRQAVRQLSERKDH